MQICRASCSMPMVTPMVRVGDDFYVDGGVADSVPLKERWPSDMIKFLWC